MLMKHVDYFYTPPQNIHGDLIEIKGHELKHLRLVSRKKAWDIVQVVDGLGNQFTVVLRTVDSQVAVGEIQKKSRYTGEPTLKLTLTQAIPKSNRFDWVIEKGTEIGVSKFIPLIAQRSVVLAGESKHNRWQNIAISAMKQCGRSFLPEITSPMTFEQFMSSSEIHDFHFIAHPEINAPSLVEIIIDQRKNLGHVPKIRTAIIMVGPEGGFTGDEVDRAKSQNYTPFSLGARRLRSETAGIISSAILMEILENFK